MVRSVGTPYTNKGCGLKYAEVKIRFLDPDTTGTDSGRARWSWNPDCRRHHHTGVQDGRNFFDAALPFFFPNKGSFS